MMSDHYIGESFDFLFLQEIFIQMGMFKNKTLLDSKSIRVLNRLKAYIEEHNLGSLEKLLEGHIFMQTIRVKGKPEK